MSLKNSTRKPSLEGPGKRFINLLKDTRTMAKGKLLSTARVQEVLDGVFEVRDSIFWPLFQQLLFILQHGTPEQIQALRNGDLSALEKATATA